MRLSTADYLEHILPYEGEICVAQLLPSGSFKHIWCLQFGEASAQLHYLNSISMNAFVAQASFKTRDNRKQSNALSLRSCFLDIDCGPGKPYVDQKDGAAGLKRFCEKTSLPLPTVTNSGNGLYAHWVFIDDVDAGVWKNTATLLGKLVNVVEPKLDADGIIADSARVLRPIGIFNWKNMQQPKEVKCIHKAEQLDFFAFSKIIQDALVTVGCPIPTPKMKTPDEFNTYTDTTKSDAHLVAGKCQQVYQMKLTRGNLTEPLWYALLNVVKHCEDGHDIAHEWSDGHPAYSEEGTDRKLNQSDCGPTTCLFLSQINPTGCTGCRFQGKITSPIQLGRPEPKKIEVEAKDEVELIDPPAYYRVSDDGIFHKVEETWQKIYPYPVYVANLVRDHALGYEVAHVRHRDPHGEWWDIHVKSSLIHDPKQLLMTLHDQHLQAPMGEARKTFMSFLEDYMQKVRSSKKLGITASQMGWCGDKKDMKFILGNEIMHQNGDVKTFNVSKAADNVASAFYQEGNRDAWIDATKYLDSPGMEPLAFGLLAGAFAAPLMKFTGYPGAMVSMVGESGVGKTLVGKWALSAYGDWNKLILLRDDTRNALIGRLGLYGSLPAYIDEITNISAEELSDLVYRVTQGRDKARLNKNSTEKTGINAWNTLAIVTSNQSLVEKLSAHKSDASAEMNRVFEYTVAGGFSREIGTHIHRTVTNNYGHVGKTYVEWLTAHQSELEDKLNKLIEMIDSKTGAEAEERYWSSIVGATILGGLIAKSLGLIQFDVSRVTAWAIDTIMDNRYNKKDNVQDGFDIIGIILDKYINGGIVVKGYNKGTNLCDGPPIRSDPRSQLVYRIEEDVHRCWISTDVIKKEFGSRHLNMRIVREKLGAHLVDTRKRMSLGRGTVWHAALQPCWEIDLTHPYFGYRGLKIAKLSEEKKRSAA